MALMSFRSRYHVKASMVLTSSDHLFKTMLCRLIWHVLNIADAAFKLNHSFIYGDVCPWKEARSKRCLNRVEYMPDLFIYF